MKTQTDYETDVSLAVFESAGQAEVGIVHLRAHRIDVHTARMGALSAGSYQCVDPSLGELVTGIVRGAELGAPIGAALGLGGALFVSHGGPEIVVGLVLVGLVVGALFGSLIGAAVRAHYDDDVALRIDVRDSTPVVLLLVETHSTWLAGPARQVLSRAGALAFLDPEFYELDGLPAPTSAAPA
jgi:hypothetical protein